MKDPAAPGGRGPPSSGGTPARWRLARLSAEEWRRLEPLIDTVLDAAPDHRAALVAELSGGNADRRAELERLVADCERSYAQLDGSAVDRFDAVVCDDTPSMPDMIADRYRVLREVGRGGMAIVYLARDLKHGRDVAVKVLRPDLAAAIRRVRFLHEIEIAAQLCHPHIVPLYDSGEVSPELRPGETGAPLLYYVMPYEAGHSLRERLERDGSLSVDDAVFIIRDVCEALAHAHQHGIVHRDIKPDNVLLSGRHALVTDFGVARAVTEATTEPATIGVSTGSTALGSTALGTPSYMAPEQTVVGARVDHRADIYAVGCVAYELLTGRPPFEEDAESPAEIADALRELTRLRPEVPATLSAAIATCLAKRPEDRWQSADALLAHLTAIVGATTSTSINTSTSTSTSAVAALSRRRASSATFLGVAAGGVVLVVLVALVALAALTLARGRSRSGPALLRIGRASQLTAERGLEVQPALSPDGRNVAYAVGHSLQMRIAIRPVAGGRARWLTADTLNAWLPRWSPDGTRILFLSGGGVFSAAAHGGSVRQEVASRPGGIVRSATWSADGREIAYVRDDSLLARTMGSGVTRLIARAPDLHSCRWSPDGAWLACVSGNSFYVTVGAISGVGPMFGNLAPSRIVLVPAVGGRPVSVTASASLHQSPVWSPDGGTLYYVSNEHGPRDVYALDVHARASDGSKPVRVTTGMGAQSIDLSADGARMAYAVYSSNANVWSTPIPTHRPALSVSAMAVTSGNQTVEGVRVSPDGRWLVYDSDLSGNSDVYRVPVAGGDPVQLTHDPSDEFRGTLAPNGRELAYHSFQSGTRNIFVLTLDGGSPRQLTRSSDQLAMANWAPDGSAISFFDMTAANVLVMRRDEYGRWGLPHVVARRGWRPEWSPDGRAIAFISPTDGRIDLVSADSGTPHDLYIPHDADPLAELAIFSASGRELYFKSHDAYGRALFWSIPAEGGRPRLLVRFDDPAWSSNRFDFASDGKRFYFTVEDRQSDVWVAEVTRP